MKRQSLTGFISGLAVSVIAFSPVAIANPNLASDAFAISPEIQLTSAQETQLEDLKNRTKSQLSNVLTTTQQAQLRDSLNRGEDFRTSIRSLDLSFRQRRQIKGIFGDVRSQLQTILTPEQQQQLEQARRSQQP